MSSFQRVLVNGVYTTSTLVNFVSVFLQVCDQFEGSNRELVAQRLGMGTHSRFEARSKWDNIADTLHSLGDLRYWVWVLGAVLGNMVSGWQLLSLPSPFPSPALFL